MSTAQMKDVLKLAVSALRQTRRLPLTEKEVSSIWRPSKWEAMGKRLATVEKFTASPALRTLCDQMTTVAGTSEVDSKARNKEPSRVRPPKRKVDERNEIEGRGARSEKPKRKKR
jgi:DNA polymerase phi